jgi:hypothetical protein
MAVAAQLQAGSVELEYSRSLKQGPGARTCEVTLARLPMRPTHRIGRAVLYTISMDNQRRITVGSARLACMRSLLLE